MEKERVWYLGYLAIAVGAIILGFISFSLMQEPEIKFSRRLLSDLIQGRESAASLIDWPTFQGLGNDVGAAYLKLPTENERGYFGKAFILNFSLSFKNAGGRLSAFTNWRIYTRDNEKTIVAADGLGNKIILFTISKKQGKMKLMALQFKE